MPRNSSISYCVTVGNIGNVYLGPSRKTAAETFAEYKTQSVRNYGRAAGESVTLWKLRHGMFAGEPMREHSGHCAHI